MTEKVRLPGQPLARLPTVEELGDWRWAIQCSITDLEMLKDSIATGTEPDVLVDSVGYVLDHLRAMLGPEGAE